MKKLLREVTFMNPVGSSKVSSPFGAKRSYETHPGVDIPVPSGTAIKAPADGIVKTANPNHNRQCGGTIDIDYGNGFWSRFCHVKRVDVSQGSIVKRGQVVGLSGGAEDDPGRGNSGGPHLHFTLKKDGKLVDPMNYVDKFDVGTQDIPMSAGTKSSETNWDDFFSKDTQIKKDTISKERSEDPILKKILEPLKNAMMMKLEHTDMITPINEVYELSNGRYISSLEYSIDNNKKVLNPEDGKVVFVGNRDNCKDSVIIQHMIEKKVYYTEFCSISDIKVKQGQNVSKNKVIGVAGRDSVARILDRSKSKISFRQFESDSGQEKPQKPEKPKLDSRKDPILDLLTKPLRALNIDTDNIRTISKNKEVEPYKWVDWLKKNTVSKNESIKENIKQIKRLL
jgi:hypothetical protein